MLHCRWDACWRCHRSGRSAKVNVLLGWACTYAMTCSRMHILGSQGLLHMVSFLLWRDEQDGTFYAVVSLRWNLTGDDPANQMAA